MVMLQKYTSLNPLRRLLFTIKSLASANGGDGSIIIYIK